MEILPVFDPSTGLSGLSANQFVERVNALKCVYGWNEKLVLFSVAGKMKGAAKLWFDCQERLLSSWADFSDALTTNFPSMVNEADIHVQMTNRHRLMDEDLDTYFFTMCSLGTNVKLSEAAVAKYIIAGLRIPALTNSLSGMPFTNTQELLARLKSYENMNRQTIPEPRYSLFLIEKRERYSGNY